VILNLAINARDAMKGERQAHARTEQRHAGRPLRGLHEPEVVAGQYVMLAISDTGCGMPPEVVARAFEPFFTTKREGEGTGLGLSMAYGFVKQSNGHIRIYSEVGSGTTIKIYLPRSMQPEVELPSTCVRAGGGRQRNHPGGRGRPRGPGHRGRHAAGSWATAC
jgi:signal transduction histidine kinase